MKTFVYAQLPYEKIGKHHSLRKTLARQKNFVSLFNFLSRRQMTSRNWILTVNNPTFTLQEVYDASKHKTIVGQLERGSEGTLHLQFYCEYVNPVRIGNVKADFRGCHAEKRKGTRAQALEYCTKDESREEGPWYFGLTMERTQSIIRGRADNCEKAELLEIKEKIKNGTAEANIADDHFTLWVRYFKAFERYRCITTKPRNHEMTVIVIQGPTGTGKSRYAMEQYPDAYWKQRSNWWCGYSGESTVVLDEFYGWLPFDLLLRLCDRYPLLVESKGGQLQMVARTIIITTNAIPDNWYNNVYFGSFERRVTEWKVMNYTGTSVYTNYADAKVNMFSN